MATHATLLLALLALLAATALVSSVPLHLDMQVRLMLDESRFSHRQSGVRELAALLVSTVLLGDNDAAASSQTSASASVIQACVVQREVYHMSTGQLPPSVLSKVARGHLEVDSCMIDMSVDGSSRALEAPARNLSASTFPTVPLESSPLNETLVQVLTRGASWLTASATTDNEPAARELDWLAPSPTDRSAHQAVLVGLPDWQPSRALRQTRVRVPFLPEYHQLKELQEYLPAISSAPQELQRASLTVAAPGPSFLWEMALFGSLRVQLDDGATSYSNLLTIVLLEYSDVDSAVLGSGRNLTRASLVLQVETPASIAPAMRHAIEHALSQRVDAFIDASNGLALAGQHQTPTDPAPSIYTTVVGFATLVVIVAALLFGGVMWYRGSLRSFSNLNVVPFTPLETPESDESDEEDQEDDIEMAAFPSKDDADESSGLGDPNSNNDGNDGVQYIHSDDDDDDHQHHLQDAADANATQSPSS